MKNKLISYCIISFCVGAFISFILTMTLVKDVFSKEIVVKVQPMGYSHYPYPPYKHYFTTLPYELHEVKIKNGNVVKVERLGYAYND